MKTVRVFILLVFVSALAGCATEKPRPTIGQTVGGGIDQAITWTSQGIKKLLNK